MTGRKAVRLPKHPYQAVPLVCLAAVAAVAIPGDSPSLWIAGAVLALTGPLLGLVANRRAVAVRHK